MTPKSDPTSLWTEEYQKSGIPSSFLVEPSGSVLEFAKILNELNVTGRAVDLGCGRGRNSLFLAQQGFSVCSVDLVHENVTALRRQAEELGLQDAVDAEVVDLAMPWPFESASFDVALDTFVYKHQTAPGVSEEYRRQLAGVMKSGGLLLLTLAGVDDGYYGPLLQTSPDPARRVIVDPANGIASILYDESHIEDEFSDNFEIIHRQHKIKDGEMHGAVYRRSTYVFVMRRA